MSVPRIIAFAVIVFLIGFSSGEIHFHTSFLPKYEIVKSNFQELKIFAEVLYYILASALIVFAYFQYVGDKRKEQREKIEYAHQLFRQYANEILILDKNYNYYSLRQLTDGASPEDKYDFNKLLNKLDTLASAFNCGLADMETGKEMFGATYCKQVTSYTPAIRRVFGDRYRDDFEHLFKLYDLWSTADGQTA